MHIRDIFQSHPTTFSFEFFPPKTADSANALYETIRELESYRPQFVSVTYGAGGSTRELTHDLVVRVKQTTTLDPVPHLTCVCHKEAEIASILERYAAAGVSNILALGGDAPKNVAYNKGDDDFPHAADLVAYIQKFNASGVHPDRRGFGVGVAGFPEGHPATPNRFLEMDYLKRKTEAGADYIVTQLFFDNRDFLDFRERCELAGITTPIIAGIMPITTISGMKRMADLAAGARVPAPLLRTLLENENDPEAVTRIGIEHAARQSEDLLENGVRGIHFYTLNRSDATKLIFENLARKYPRFEKAVAA